MRLSSSDIAWLNAYLPGLRSDSQMQQISGELGFCAAFDRNSGNLEIGDTPDNRGWDTFVCDAFQVKVCLDSVDDNGWPRVYETGGRYQAIAARNLVPVIDLHFYSDGACCLGLNFAPAENLTLTSYIYNLLIPFLYRLAYTDKFGIDAARNYLWGEYSHGDIGHVEHRAEVNYIAYVNPGRNKSCPCGSGRKYKRCHLDEVEAAKLWGLIR